MPGTSLHYAVLRSCVESVKILLKAGADVNGLDFTRSLPLHYALEKSHTEIVKILLEHGADVNALDLNGSSPLQYAVKYSHAEIVKILLEHGASVNALDMWCQTPLYDAIKRSDEDSALFDGTTMVELLLEHGADVNVLDHINRTPLHHFMAVKYPDISVLKTLIKYGANVDAVSPQGESVLYVAVSNPAIPYEMVKLLLENGATPDFNEKRNILVSIHQPDRYHIAELLIKYIIIRKAANSENFDFLSQFISILLTDTFEYPDSYKHFLRFACKCAVEVKKMKEEFINNEQSLFEFVSQNCSRSTPHDQSGALNSIDALLLLLNNGRYVVCKELIYAAIKRSVLVERLCELLVCHQVADSDTVTLNYDCVNRLAKYLSKNDVFNMINVFCDKFGDYECPNTYTTKRIADEGDENVSKKLRK